MKPLVWMMPLVLAACALNPKPQPVTVDGFAKARFGDTLATLKKAVGKPLYGGSDSAAQCQMLFENPDASQQFGMAFMVENGRFVRLDVDSPGYLSPGGIKVGDPLAKAEQVFAGRSETLPHKYQAGVQLLVVSGPAWQGKKLVFEAGADGLVRSWRLGVMPAVLYMERCG